jgi:hypothetical protein
LVEFWRSWDTIDCKDEFLALYLNDPGKKDRNYGNERRAEIRNILVLMENFLVQGPPKLDEVQSKQGIQVIHIEFQEQMNKRIVQMLRTSLNCFKLIESLLEFGQAQHKFIKLCLFGIAVILVSTDPEVMKKKASLSENVKKHWILKLFKKALPLKGCRSYIQKIQSRAIHMLQIICAIREDLQLFM